MFKLCVLLVMIEWMVEMYDDLLLWKPKLKETIYFNDIFLDDQGKGKWIVGERDSDIHFLLTASQKDFFGEVCELFDGKHTIEEITFFLNVSIGKVLAVAKVLYEKSMLYDEAAFQHTIKFNEVDRYSISILKYSFPKVKNREKLMQKANTIFCLVSIFLLVNLLLFIGLIIRNKFGFFAEVSVEELFSVGNSEANMVLGYLAVNVGMVVMFVFHELGHVLLGLKNGIQPDKFSFVLFLGFIPMFYVKNKNIYTLTRRRLCYVLLAGVYFNLILAVLCINLYFLFENDLFKIFALSNIRIILVNLWPLSLSDGYYILSVWLKRPNMRMKLHYFIANPKIFFEYTRTEKIYVILAFFIMLFIIGMEFFWVLSLFNLPQDYKVFVTCLLIAIYIIFLYIVEKKTLHKKQEEEMICRN